MTIVTRFAPSPTGFLHLGNARTAIITWLFARKNNGKFILRIDDTDTARSKQEYTDAIFQDLEWLGLNWDEVAYQNSRMDKYNSALETLKSKDRIYPCYETPDELALKRKSLLGRGLPPIYDRASLNLTSEQIESYEKDGRKPHWRFKMEHKTIEWHDSVRGEVVFQGKDLSDPVVIREDGTPLYHICSVVDDIEYNITHITRGEDHVSNTACHIQMFEALGSTPPDFAHITFLSGKDGEKLSKRLGSLSLKDLREETGLEATALTSVLSRIGTSAPIEPQNDINDTINGFDFSKFSRNLPKLNIDELYRVNSKILHELSFDDIKQRLIDAGLEQINEDFWLTIRSNISIFSDIKEWWQVANGPVKPVVKDQEFINTAAELLPDNQWSSETWNTWMSAIKDKTGRKGKELFMPIRLSLTGQEHGPELKDLLLLIGREKTLERLNYKN